MKRHFKPFGLWRAALLLLLLQTACDKPNDVQPVLTNNPLQSELDRRVDQWVRPYTAKAATAGVSIGILQHGKAYYYGYGEISKGSRRIPDSTTLFEIGSLTKLFTAAMVVDFVQTKGWSPEMPIRSLLPATLPVLAVDGKEIRLQHLLNHTSGLPRLPTDFWQGTDPLKPYEGYDSSRVYQNLKSIRLAAVPGSTFSYSNYGMGLAGLILERNSGQRYQTYLQERICGPLGLKNTGLDIPASTVLAKGYDAEGREVPYWDDLAGLKGAGAIRSTARDMLLFAQHQLYLTSPLSEVFRICQKVSFQDTDYKIGYGWFYYQLAGTECLVHDGGTGGFNSFLYVSKTKELAVVVLFNNSTQEAAPVANGLMEELLRNAN
jgi:CubicO group peptidase (beta-lactamase class C family)